MLFGNIDPSGVIGRGSVEDVETAAAKLIETWMPGGLFILNAGCAIPSTSPGENIVALVQSAWKYGRM